MTPKNPKNPKNPKKNATPLRVAMDIGSLIGPRTGIGVFTRRLLDGLASRRDMEVVGWAATWRGRAELLEFQAPGVTIAQRPLPARPMREVWKRVNWPPLSWWTGPADVVFGPNYFVPPTKAASVVSVHDLTVLRYPELCTRDTLEYPRLLRRAIKRGAWIHTDTQAVADEVIDAFAVNPERVRHVPLAADELPDLGAPSQAEAGWVLAGGKRYILALGTVEPRKDLPGLVAAFDIVADTDAEVRLVVAGPNGWGAPQFDAAMAASRHWDRITRLGWVDDAGRAALLRGATVLAYPSLYEGFGIPPLEAMSVGTAVVASDVPAVAEVCGDAAVLVPVGDTEALAAALTRVVDGVVSGNRGVAAMCNAGRRRAQAMRWDTTVAGMARLLADAVADRTS